MRVSSALKLFAGRVIAINWFDYTISRQQRKSWKNVQFSSKVFLDIYFPHFNMWKWFSFYILNLSRDISDNVMC